MRTQYIALGLLIVCLPIEGQEQGLDLKKEGNILRPERVEASAERVGQLKLPPNFRIQKFAEGLDHTRMLAAGPNGRIYVTRPKQGDVLMLVDENGDGRADQKKTVAEKDQVHGIELQESAVYLATVQEVYRAEVKQDGSFGELEEIISGIAEGGQHPNRTLRVGPDGLLYTSIGSLSNAQVSPSDKETACIIRTQLDGSGKELFAEGLRNTIGFGWHPETKEMWGMDHGIDWLGDKQPPEELNQLEEGQHYGWPWVWGNGQITPQAQPPEGKTKEQMARESIPPRLTYTAHSAPMQMVFYTGNGFPQEYRGDAFVAMRGSWNRRPPSGYEVVRIVFENGKPERIEPFLSGFLIEEDGKFKQFARLAGITQGTDGALYVSDDEGGIIYRISHSSMASVVE